MSAAQRRSSCATSSERYQLARAGTVYGLGVSTIGIQLPSPYVSPYPSFSGSVPTLPSASERSHTIEYIKRLSRANDAQDTILTFVIQRDSWQTQMCVE